MALSRKIIQFESNDDGLGVLCNDGTMWCLSNEKKWKEWFIPKIPQPGSTKPKNKYDFDFSKWPNSADPEVFKNLCKSRRSKTKVEMTQAYIDSAASHLLELSSKGIGVNDALKVATIHGWQGFKASWVLKELGTNIEPLKVELKTLKCVMSALNSGSLTSIRDVPSNLRKEVESQYRIGNCSPEICKKLEDIGLVI